MTGFTDTEEQAVQLTKVVPFLVEDELKRLGGLYAKGPDWASFVQVDGNLITGQNPASSSAAAREQLKDAGNPAERCGNQILLNPRLLEPQLVSVGDQRCASGCWMIVNQRPQASACHLMQHAEACKSLSAARLVLRRANGRSRSVPPLPAGFHVNPKRHPTSVMQPRPSGFRSEYPPFAGSRGAPRCVENSRPVPSTAPPRSTRETPLVCTPAG